MAKGSPKKRAESYERKLSLKDGVEFGDLLGVALKTPAEKPKPKVKRVKSKGKKTKR